MTAEDAGIRRAVAAATLRRRHNLPFPGEILVEAGESIDRGAVWARCRPGGRVSVRELARMTPLPPARVSEALLSREGEAVPEGELLARGRGGLLRSQDWAAEWPGSLRYVSKISGLAFFAESTDPAPLYARLGGTVTEVEDGSHIVVEGEAVAIAGAFGGGGTGFGDIMMAGEGQPPTAPDRNGGESDLLVFTDSLQFEWLTAYPRERVAGVIAPSVSASEIESRTGLPPTRAALAEILRDVPVLFTEGAGNATMPAALQRRFRAHVGRPASLNGSTGPGEAEVLLMEAENSTDEGDETARLRIGGGRLMGSEVVLIAGEAQERRTRAGQLTPHLEVRSEERGRMYVPVWNLELLGPGCR